MQDNVLYIGQRNVWGGTTPFGLSDTDLNQHLFITGKSGTGKSTLLKSLVSQLIASGSGVALIDPHGDLAIELLDLVPSPRIEDVVYFNPADREFPIGFNLLASVDAIHREHVASSLVSSLRSLWRDFFGPRMEYILYASTLALLECQNVTILSLQRMLTDDRYLSWVLRQVKDPIVQQFFQTEFRAWDDNFRQEAVAPILNKTGQTMLAPVVRSIVGQVKRKIDPRFMMDHRRILIANLSKGTLGEDKASILGSLLVAGFAHAAMTRANLPAAERVPYTLVVDEFASFGSDMFASILSEARKYGLRLVLATQFLDQIDDRIRSAIFGNVGNMLTLRVGEKDAQILEREYGSVYDASAFSSQSNFEAIAKVLDGGVQREPFHIRTEPWAIRSHGTRDKVIARSREKYGTPRQVIDSRIERWVSHGTQTAAKRRRSSKQRRL